MKGCGQRIPVSDCKRSRIDLGTAISAGQRLKTELPGLLNLLGLTEVAQVCYPIFLVMRRSLILLTLPQI